MNNSSVVPLKPGEESRHFGSVSFFNERKGYGFITPDEGGSDVFVHVTILEKNGLSNLDGGQRVSFTAELGKKDKPVATDVHLLKSKNNSANRNGRVGGARTARRNLRRQTPVCKLGLRIRGSVSKFNLDEGQGIVQLDGCFSEVAIYSDELNQAGIVVDSSVVNLSVYVKIGLDSRSGKKKAVAVWPA